MNNSLQFLLENSYILAIEDSLVQAKRLEYFFKEYNINYLLYTNAEEAYNAILKQKPALIISDIVMPGMDGYEFCKKIKTNEELSKIPVILLTSLQDPHDIIKGLQAGADNFITKPYDEKHLFSRIQYLLINRDIRFSGNAEMFIELVFRGQKYQINSDKKQILDLLLSVYESAIQRNDELIAIKAQLEKSNENLKLANQDLDAFSQTVSHDLKSPLNGIIGFSDILLSDNTNNINTDSREMLEFINKSAWNMSNLIQDLLEFAKSGEVVLEQEPVNITQIATEVMEYVLKRDSNRKIKVNIQPNLNGKADPKMLKVVFDNLFGNAFKFTSLKTETEISFGRKDYYGHNLYFVKDNGAGFDMKRADKLFQPFQRLHFSNEFKGTGLGLSIVKRIIEKHGGQIWVESEIDLGTTFFFTLGD
ncbi:MAG: response regulator [Bacteroidales bacterium]